MSSLDKHARRIVAASLSFTVAASALLAIPAAATRAVVSTPVSVSSGDPLPLTCDTSGGSEVTNGQREWQVEPTLVVNPTDPKNLVTAWTQDFADGIVASSSTDGGAHWKQTIVPQKFCTTGLAEFQKYTSAHNSWLSFGADGVAYVSSVLGVANCCDGSVVVNRSADKGRTWSPPAILDEADANNNVIDESNVVADPARARRAYAVWTKGNADAVGEPVIRNPYFSRTTDGGRTWLHDASGKPSPVQIYSAPAGQLVTGNRLVVLPGGALIDVFSQVPFQANPTSVNGPTTLLAMTSADRGDTWSGPYTVASLADATHYVIADAAVAPDGTIYVAWQTSRYPACVSGDEGCTSIVYSKSGDGISWTTPAAVASVQGSPMIGANGILEQPRIAVGGDGTVGVMFYDHRNSTVPNLPPAISPLYTDVWFDYSRDGGATWAEEPVAGSFDIQTAPDISGDNTATRGNGYLGEYQGLAATCDGFVLSFAQPNPTLTLPHNTDIYFARVSLMR